MVKMFNGLRNEILELNRDVNNVANSEKAKKLKGALENKAKKLAKETEKKSKKDEK